MKRLLFIILLLTSMSLWAAPKINKDSCTITLDNGKTLPLYGRVQVVENFEDIRVEIVTSFADLKVDTNSSFADDCGKWQFVTSFPDIKVKFFTSFADVKIEYVSSFPGIN